MIPGRASATLIEGFAEVVHCCSELDGLVQRDFVEVNVNSNRINTGFALLLKAVREVGRRFRRTVLALGGGTHPSEVFRAFRGRDPSPEALLRHSGLD